MRLAETLMQDNLRTGRFHGARYIPSVRAEKLGIDKDGSVASVHENHSNNLAVAMKAVRSIGGKITKIKHLDYSSLPMLKKRGVATGDMAKSTVHFTSGKNKLKLHVRTAHKIGMEGGEHNKTFEMGADDASE